MTKTVNFTIKIHTSYGEFLATKKYNHELPVPDYDAVRVGSMVNGVYPPLSQFVFVGDYAIEHLSKGRIEKVQE